MSIFNEPIDPTLVTQLNRKQDLMGKKEERTPIELTFLNSNSSWVKLQSSVEIKDYPEAAKRNVLLGGTLSFTPKDENTKSPERWDARDGVAVGDNAFNANNKYTSNINVKIIPDTPPPITGHMLGLRPMPGITSLRVESIGAYGSVRKATVNFQCWDIRQLEVLEALYMRPGYTVLLEFGRNFYLDETSKVLNKTQPKNNFFSNKVKNLQAYLSNLYSSTLSQGGHYDAFFGYVVNYKWSYRSDGGYDCMTEIISTGEVAESIKMNHSVPGTVRYTAFGTSDITNAQNAAFKGLFLPSANSGKTLENADVIRLNNEYAENVLSGLIYEIYTAIRYTDPKDDKKSTGLIQIPKRYKTQNDTHIPINWSKISYKSTADPSQPTEENPAFLTANDNYYVTLDSFCKLITEYNLPYAYDGNFTTQYGNLTAISTDSRYYTKKAQSSDPLLCLYNNLIISTNPDVCWIKNNEWTKIASGSNAAIEVITTPPAAVLAGYGDSYVNSNYSADLQKKINQWINDVFYNYSSFKTSAPEVLQDIYNTREQLLNANNFLVGEKDFAEAVQANFQVIRGGIDSTGFRDWRGLDNNHLTQDQRSKLNLREYLRQTYQPDSNTFWNLINGPINARMLFLPLAFSTEQKQVFNSLGTYGILNTRLTKLDNEIQKTAPVVQQAQDAQAAQTQTAQTLTALDEALNKVNNRFKKDFKYDKKTNGGTSLSDFGVIGNIYINLKHAYILAKDRSLLSSDQAGKNTLSLGKYFDTLVQNLQTSLGNVNNFKIHIDPIDGVARIIDLNYININQSPEVFKFNIGNSKTIIRDLKLESQVFSNQMAMIAISAQAEPGKLAYDNTSLTSYNEGITDRNIEAKNSAYATKSNDAQFVLNFISNLGFLVNKYLKNLLGLEVTKEGSRGGTAETADAASGEWKEYEPNYNADNSNSYSNVLRDIIAYATSYYLMDNANKALLPTQISLTIDGMSGLVIGNLFKVDNNFIPKFYKNSARDMGYTITGLNHDVSDNDWTTTIQGYPVDLSSNSVPTQNPSDFSGIVYIDDEGKPRVDNSGCGEATIDVLPLLKQNNIIVNTLEGSKVTPQFYSDLEKYIIPFMKKYSKSLIVTSVNRPGDPGRHGDGNAIDFQINGISAGGISGQWAGKTYSSWQPWADARVGKRTTTFDTSKENKDHPYTQAQLNAINQIQQKITTEPGFTPTGTDLAGAYYEEIKIGSGTYRFLNENYTPSKIGVKGPHFHFQRQCSKTTPTTTPATKSKTNKTPASTPPKSTPLSITPTPSNSPRANSTPQTTPGSTNVIPPSQTPSNTPPKPTPIPSNPPTTPPAPSPTIMEVPSSKSTWKFPYTVNIMLSADGTPGRDVTILNRIENGNGSWIGGVGAQPNITDLDSEISRILRKMYSDGVKPKVTNVDFGDNAYEIFSNNDGSVTKVNIHWRVTINESNDGLAWTGFKSRKKASSSASDINDLRFFENQKSVNLLGQLTQEIIGEYGSFPRKGPSPVGDIKFIGNPFQKPQIWYRHIFFNYTDKNPEGGTTT